MIFKSILSSLLLFTPLAALEHVEDLSNLTIDTPSLKERKTAKIRLENGLEALLISDPGAHQSGAALAVNVGSWDDPKDRMGMAHFVEHLLFLGTEKYPEESEYTRYLDEQGGTRNAFTTDDRTVYMFSVNNEGFSGALDRFSQFFIAPLFNPSGVERECHAIEQEFRKDVPIDAWRQLHVKKELANPNHPFSSFSIGNLDTLAKISQDELKEWYAAHYSANIMHLVVVSDRSLESLEEEVVKRFAAVPNKKITPNRYTQPLLSSDTVAKLVRVKPQQPIQALELTWELPRSIAEDREASVDRLMSHVLGHEGETSLLAQLKAEELAEGLAAGTQRPARDHGLFSLTIHLTAKGLKNYEKVIERTFEALASMKQSGIPRYIYDELESMTTLQYRYQSRQEIFSFVASTAYQMCDEPLATYPRTSLMPTRYDENKNDAFLGCLSPYTCRYTLVADFPKRTPYVKEQWMEVAYRVEPIPREKIEKWAALEKHKEIAIPAPNHFLPEKLSLYKGEEKEPPHLLVDTPSAKIFCASDHDFQVPEVSWIFTLKTPKISAENPKSQVLADLYCHSVKEHLNTLAYEAQMGGLSYSLIPAHNGLQLKVRGFNEKAPLFIETVAKELRCVQPTPEAFALYKEMVSRDYRIKGFKSPITQGLDLQWSVLMKDYAPIPAKQEALGGLKYRDFSTFCKSLWDENYVEGTLYGNHNDVVAKKVAERFQKALGGSPYPQEKHLSKRLATLPATPKMVMQKSELPGNALLLTLDCGEFSFKRRAAQEILSKGLEEPFFSELRTRQQTAYHVTNWSQEIERHLYSFFAIQSSSHNPRDLLARFELFFENSLKYLKSAVIPEERFEAIRASLVYQLNHPADHLAQMGRLLHTQAFDYDGDFHWLDKRIAGLEELTYDEFVAYAHEFLGKENRRRLAISVSGELAPKKILHYSPVQALPLLKKEIVYKSR